MPTYEVTSPDGRTFEVTAPDGATQDQVLAYAQKNFAPAQPKSDESPMQAGLIGAGRMLTQLGRGAQQAYFGVTGDQQAQDALKAKSDEVFRREWSVPFSSAASLILGTEK